MSGVLFLVAADKTPAEDMCPAGEPVIPTYPAGPLNTFIGTKTFKPCATASVTFLQGADADMDAMCARLMKQFPGLPEKMHQAYVVKTALSAAEIGINHRVSAVVNYDEASLAVDDGRIITMWDKVPLEGL